MRDLLGVTVDVADLLPSDGGDFGFDNIATALTTSPLLLERYLTAGLRIAELAVGDAGAEPGTATYTISTVVTQNQHVEGLPLGTRGGMLVPHTFPADGEYVFSGRLLKTVAEGLVGVEGHETPHHFIVTIDGKQVFSAPIGGKDGSRGGDREQAGGARRVRQAHDVAAHQGDRRAARGRLHLRRAADAGTEHVAAGAARHAGGAQPLRAAAAAQRHHRRAVQRRRRQRQPSRQRCSSARRRRRRRKRPAPTQILSTVARRAFRRPVTKADIDAPMAIYREERAAGGDFDAGIRAGLARILTSPSFLFRSEQDPGGARGRRGASRQRARAGEPAVVLPLEQHPGRRAAEPGDRRAGCARPACSRRRCGA